MSEYSLWGFRSSQADCKKIFMMIYVEIMSNFLLKSTQEMCSQFFFHFENYLKPVVMINLIFVFYDKELN